MLWLADMELSYIITTSNDDAFLFIYLMVEDMTGGGDLAMPAVYDPAKDHWVVKGISPGGNFFPGRFYLEYAYKSDPYLTQEEVNQMLRDHAEAKDEWANAPFDYPRFNAATDDELLAQVGEYSNRMSDIFLSAFPAVLPDMNVTADDDGVVTSSFTGTDGQTHEFTISQDTLDESLEAALISRANSAPESEITKIGNVRIYEETTITVNGRAYTREGFAHAAGEAAAEVGVYTLPEVFAAMGIASNDTITISQNLYAYSADGGLTPQPIIARAASGIINPMTASGEFGILAANSNPNYSSLNTTMNITSSTLYQAEYAFSLNSGTASFMNGVSTVTSAIGIGTTGYTMYKVNTAFDAHRSALNELTSFMNSDMFQYLTSAEQKVVSDFWLNSSGILKAGEGEKNLSNTVNILYLTADGCMLLTGVAGAGKTITQRIANRTAMDIGTKLKWLGDINKAIFGQGDFHDEAIRRANSEADMILSVRDRYFSRAVERAKKPLTDSKTNTDGTGGDKPPEINPNLPDDILLRGGLYIYGEYVPFGPKWKHDPSGFAYENGDLDNRVEGVRAEIWTSDDENGTYARYWDEAEEWDEVNPQITGETGWYAWNVPVGWWQVRLYKDGYHEARSEWLPVLPEQLGVNLEMIPIGTAPTITTESLRNGTVGTAYNQILSATGTTPIKWSIISSNLPDGMTLSGNGEITGTPTASGTFSFTVNATNNAGSATKALSITISEGDEGGVVISNAVTTPKDFISIVETAKNSRIWVLTFNVTLTCSDNTTKTVRYSINLSGNNANLDGRFKFPAGHDLAGYTLIYDIKGNGSNIKEFRLVRN